MSKKLNPELLSILQNHQLVDKGGEYRQLNPTNLQAAWEEISSHFDKTKTLQLELEKLEAILDATPCTISWIDDQYRYGGVNQALADIIGLESQSFSGQSIGSITGTGAFYEFAEEIFNSSDETIYKELIGRVSGEEKIYWTSARKFNNQKQAIIIGIDITELKHLRDTVVFQEKLSALGEMVAGIIHEVNNPLSVINLIALALKKKFDNPELAPYIQDLEKTSKRISSIITGVKKFVRKGEGEPPTVTSVGQILNDALSICEHKFKQAGIRFSFEANGIAELPIECNETQLFQIFVNLFNNSIDALEENQEKWIKLTTQDLGDRISLSFQDSGKGIPKDMASKIFESFFTTKPAGKGTGLGLSLCQKIVESHGGTMEIDFSATHTTFVIQLPKKAVGLQAA